MSELITTQGTDLSQPWDREQIKIIKQSICPGINDAELMLFERICREKELSPFSKEIYPLITNGKKGGRRMTTITGIDGFRKCAQRTGEYEGQTAPQWCGSDGKWVDVWSKKEKPAACRVGVWRKGFREPAMGVVVFTEFYSSGGLGLWDRMPTTMIEKCAEAKAFRKAFGESLSGLYAPEEMDQAKEDAIETTAKNVTPQNVLRIDQQNKPAQPQQQPQKTSPMPEKTVLSVVMGLIAQILKEGMQLGWSQQDALKHIYGLMNISGRDQLKGMEEIELEGFEVTLREMLDNVDEVFQIQQ